MATRTFHIFDAKVCPIKLEHIHTDTEDPGQPDHFKDAFQDQRRCRGAYMLIRMLKEWDGLLPALSRLPAFRAADFQAFCVSVAPFDWSCNPSHRQGFEHLIDDGYIMESTVEGFYEISFELLALCYMASPEPSVFGRPPVDLVAHRSADPDPGNY